MKTVCKKLLSLMLVAVLLMSAIPFQALAAETTPEPVHLKVYINNTEVSDTVYGNPGSGETISRSDVISKAKAAIPSSYNDYYLVEEGTIVQHGSDTNQTSDFARNPDSVNIHVWFNMQQKPLVTVKTYNISTGAYVGSDNTFRHYGALGYNEIVNHANTNGVEVDSVSSMAAGGSANVTTDTTFTVNVKNPPQTTFDVTVKTVVDGTDLNADYVIENVSSVSASQLLNKVPANTQAVTYKVQNPISGTVAVTADVTYTVNVTSYNEKLVTFKDYDGTTLGTKYTVDGVLTTTVDRPTRTGYQFTHWATRQDGYGDQFTAPPVQNPADTYYAAYQTGNDDGVSKINVWAVFFDGDKRKEIFLNTISSDKVTDGISISNWVRERETSIWDAICDLPNIDADSYEWRNRLVYDYNTGNALVNATDILKGDRDIYVKINAIDEAEVIIYLHKKFERTYYDTFVMNPTAPTSISRTAVIDLIAKEWSFKTENFYGLYDASSWADALDGDEDTDANRIYIDDNGSHVIHVVIKNAVRKNGSGSSSDNYKTGDNFYMVVTVLGVSATGLACLYFFGKKKWAVK